MQELKDDMLQRTYQIRSSCLAMESTGIETVMALADQGEKLKGIDVHIKSMDATLNDSKQNIKRLKGMTQRVMDSFRTKLHRKIFSKIMLHSTGKQNSLPSSSTASPRRRQSAQVTPKTLQRRIPSTKSFTEDQIDDALGDIEGVIYRLKSIAQDMNDQLVGQADTLQRIHKNVIDSTNHIEQQNTDLKKMI